MDEKAPKVFVSYAHESEDFRQKVGELAEFLRSKGIPVVTDHPYQNRAPEEGWRAWMQKNIEDSDVVLIVCTPRYRESFEKRDVERPAGYGSSWEAALITQELYESKLYNAKYIPILPDGGTHPDDLPAVLRDYWTNLRFPSQQERIWQAVLEKHSDPNADLPPFRRRPPGQLCADDNRLAPDQRDVFGREQEIEQVLKFLNGSRPALHLTGTAGIGKTEICKRSLRIWLEQSPNAQAYWVNISDTATPEECAAAIARALGHDNIEKTDDLFSLLRPGLYYLDNLESLDSPAGNDLLRRLININNVRVLASSRARLAALGKPIEVDALPIEAAVVTFCEAWTGHESMSDTPPLREFIERDLGCHALSIVLVAALGEAKPLDRIMADWREKGTSIAQKANDPTRRGSLAVSLRLTADAVAARHSDALLLWSVAALFPDGLDEDVLYRLNPNASKPDDVALQLLVQYRVLTRRDKRYHLLPPVARFALDEAQKEAGGFSWAAAKKVVLPLLLHLVRAADTPASTDEALIARAALLNNFSAVHRFVLQECQQAQPDAKLMGYFAKGLHNWFSFNIPLGKDILEKLLPVLKNASVHPVPYAGALLALGQLESRIGNVERARNLFNQAVELFRKEQHDLGRANALVELGRLESRIGNVERARNLFNQAVELFRKEQHDLGRANALRALGQLERRIGNVERARNLFNQVVELYRKEQHDLGRANALVALGQLEIRIGNVERARNLFNQAVELFRKEQHDLGRANALVALGQLEIRIGNVERARNLFNQAVELYRKEQDDLGRANALLALGQLEIRIGNVERARNLFDQAVELFRKEQHDLGRANALVALGQLEIRIGNVERARNLFNQAVELFRKEQHDLGRANALLDLGQLEIRIGNVERARNLFNQAVELFRKEQHDLGRANALLDLGQLEIRIGNVERARNLFNQAVELYRKEQDDLGRANALVALGQLESHIGNVERARNLFNQAVELYRKEQHDLGRANALVALGQLESLIGNVERARNLFNQAVELYRKEQHDLGRANALVALGQLESLIGNVERARNLFNQAVELYRKEQDDLGRANALQGMGNLLFEEKRFVEALDVYRRALDLYQREQEPVGMAYTAADILRCLHASGNGQADEMRQLAEHSMTMALASGTPSVVDYVRSCLVEVGVIDPNDLGQ